MSCFLQIEQRTQERIDVFLVELDATERAVDRCLAICSWLRPCAFEDTFEVHLLVERTIETVGLHVEVQRVLTADTHHLLRCRQCVRTLHQRHLERIATGRFKERGIQRFRCTGRRRIDLRTFVVTVLAIPGDFLVKPGDGSSTCTEDGVVINVGLTKATDTCSLSDCFSGDHQLSTTDGQVAILDRLTQRSRLP